MPFHLKNCKHIKCGSNIGKYFVSQMDYNKKFDYDKIAVWAS